MEILKNFGVEWQLLLAQVINFLIIFYLLKRFLYKPIFNLLKKRQDTIKEGLEKAEEGKKELEKALVEEKKIIQDAHNTAKQIIDDSREQAQELANEIEERAKQQADRMIDDAKIQIDIETRKAETALYKYISDLSIKLLKKSLPNIISDKEQSGLVAKAIKEFQKKPN